MSVQEQGAHLIAAEGIEIRPTMRPVLVKVATAIISFFNDTLGGSNESHIIKSWAAVERVQWHRSIRHEPTPPTWYNYGGFR